MEREEDRTYPIFEQMSTEELENLLAQDFAATDGEPDIDYIMAIMEVIEKRETAAENRVDVDAAWKDFQENYMGQADAYDHSIDCEAESSQHLHQTTPSQTPGKRKRILRFAVVAAAVVVLLGGTAMSFERIFQAVVIWTAETFGFEAPYGAASERSMEDPYRYLREAVAELTDLPVIPNWAPEGTVKDPGINIQVAERFDSTKLLGSFKTETGQFTVRVLIYNEVPADYKGDYQWDEDQIATDYEAGGLSHDIVQNKEKNAAAWTNENVECLIQGDLTVEELEKMIDSIYEE